MDLIPTRPSATRPRQVVWAAALFVVAGLFIIVDRLVIGPAGGSPWRQFAVLSVAALGLSLLLPAWLIWRLPRYWSSGRHMVLRVAFGVTVFMVLTDVLLTMRAVRSGMAGGEDPCSSAVDRRLAVPDRGDAPAAPPDDEGVRGLGRGHVRQAGQAERSRRPPVNTSPSSD